MPATRYRSAIYFNAIDFRAFTVSRFFWRPAFTLTFPMVRPFSESLTKFLSEVQFTLRALTEKLST